jgi:hypothetical protein
MDQVDSASAVSALVCAGYEIHFGTRAGHIVATIVAPDGTSYTGDDDFFGGPMLSAQVALGAAMATLFRVTREERRT